MKHIECLHTINKMSGPVTSNTLWQFLNSWVSHATLSVTTCRPAVQCGATREVPESKAKCFSAPLPRLKKWFTKVKSKSFNSPLVVGCMIGQEPHTVALYYRSSIDFVSKCWPQHKMAVPCLGFWLRFCTVEGSDNMSSIFFTTMLTVLGCRGRVAAMF